MSQKRIAKLLGGIPGTWTPPSPDRLEKERLTLLEAGIVCVLISDLSEAAALKSLHSIRSAYADWNELRVSQVQEFEGLLATKSQTLQRSLARAIKDFLQEVFQTVHGFDLEPLREDPAEAAKVLVQLVRFGAARSHFLLLLALGGESCASMGLIRVLDRAGLMKRTSSIRRGSESLGKLVPAKSRGLFAARFGSLVEFCDSKKPMCWECSIHEECGFGKKVFKDWTAQQKRLEEHRRREEEARLRAEERERKREEAQAKRRAEQLAKAEEKRKRLADAAKKAVARKVAAKKAAAKKVAAKKVAAKKAAAKKAAAKKAATKKAAAKKKPTAKKATKKGAPKKKPAAKKKAVKKAAPKKVAKKPVPKKKPASKKPASKKKPAPKKSVKRKPVTKKQPASRAKKKSRK